MINKMKVNFISQVKKAFARIMPLAAILTLGTSCERFFETEGDCDPHYFVRFVYDMNMLKADAFSTQVESVDLYIFDSKTGNLVKHYADQGEPLAQAGYLMPIDVPAGDYDFVAWCGLADNEGHFTVASNIGKIEDATCSLTARKDDAGVSYCDDNLHALYHGITSDNLPDEQGDHITTVKLTKDTNNIVLTLQHSTDPMDPARYEMAMVYGTTGNTELSHNNSVLASAPIEYRPWGGLRGGSLASRAEGDEDAEDGEEGDDETAEQRPGWLTGEFAVSRLMTEHAPQIVVYDKVDNEIKFSFPFIEYALKFRSRNYSSMDEQEYLDRESDYSMTVILANDGGWYAVSIIINGWDITEDKVIL